MKEGRTQYLLTTVARADRVLLGWASVLARGCGSVATGGWFEGAKRVRLAGGLTTAIRYVRIGIARSVSLHLRDKVFGYALRIDLAPEECNSERAGCESESDAGGSRMRGGCGKRKVFVMFAFFLLERESVEGKGGISGR